MVLRVARHMKPFGRKSYHDYGKNRKIRPLGPITPLNLLQGRLIQQSGPSLKRPRTEDSPGGPNNTSSHTSTSNPSQTPGHTPAPTEQLLARISQLTEELNSTRAARDRTTFERDSIRTAYTAEQRRHRETLYQKEAVEAALSQEKAERARILTEFGAVLVYGPNPTGQDGKQKTVRLCSDECDKSSERIQTLQREMSEAQVRHLGEQNTARNHATKQLDDARATIQRLESDLKRSNFDLSSTQQSLKLTQESLESMERERASTVQDYEKTKGELELYKRQLENEQMLVLELKDTLIPAVYRSLGTTQESLNAVMSAIEIPRTSELGDARSK